MIRSCYLWEWPEVLMMIDDELPSDSVLEYLARPALVITLLFDRVYVYVRGREILGCVIVSPAENMLGYLVTKPGARRQGIGTKLLARAEEVLRNQGHKYARLRAIPGRESYYLKRGYKPLRIEMAKLLQNIHNVK